MSHHYTFYSFEFTAWDIIKAYQVTKHGCVLKSGSITYVFEVVVWLVPLILAYLCLVIKSPLLATLNTGTILLQYINDHRRLTTH